MSAIPGIGRVLRSVAVNVDGGLQAGTRVTVSQGFAGLIDLFARPVGVHVLDAGKTAEIGGTKVGTSLRHAMGTAHGRFSQ